MKSDDGVWFLQIPDIKAYRILELSIPPRFKPGLWINSSLYLNSTKGILKIDSGDIWQIVRVFEKDTAVVDFIVSSDEQYILYSLVTDTRKFFFSDGSSYESVLLLEDYKHDSAIILCRDSSVVFFDLNWFGDHSIAFLRRYHGTFPIGRMRAEEQIEFRYEDGIMILDLYDLSICRIDYLRSEKRLSVSNDTLIIWIENTGNNIKLPLSFPHPIRIESYESEFIKRNSNRVVDIRPLPTYESGIFYDQNPRNDSLILLDLKNSLSNSVYIAKCDEYIISLNDSLIACITNTHQTNFWTGDRRILLIKIIDAQNRIHSAVDKISF